MEVCGVPVEEEDLTCSELSRTSQSDCESTPSRNIVNEVELCEVVLQRNENCRSSVVSSEKLEGVLSGNCQNMKICSWNVWALPFASHRCLTNPQKCANYICTEIANQHKWDTFSGLIVVNIQELWGWKTGLFPPFILNLMRYIEMIPYLGYLISVVIILVSFLIGAIPFLHILPIAYDPKKQFISGVKKYLKYAVSFCDIPWNRFIDNGLLIVSNYKPMKSGYANFTHSKCDDSMANKGFIWAYFDTFHTLVINTHLQAAGSSYIRELQLKQISKFIQEWKSLSSDLKIIVSGDFNIDQRSNAVRLKRLEEMKFRDFELGSNYDGSIERSISDQYRNSSNETSNRRIPLSLDVTDLETLTLYPPQFILDRPFNRNFLCLCCRKPSQHIQTYINPNKACKIPIDSFPKKIQILSSDVSRMNIEESFAWNDLLEMAADDPIQRLIGVDVLHKTYLNIEQMFGFKKISSFEPTYKTIDWNIDHIFVSFETYNIRNYLFGKRGGLSDHFCVITEFQTQ